MKSAEKAGVQKSHRHRYHPAAQALFQTLSSVHVEYRENGEWKFGGRQVGIYADVGCIAVSDMR
jgi:hypothetical protein